MNRNDIVSGEHAVRGLRSVVYVATFPNGKRYVGITRQKFLTRLKEHERRKPTASRLSSAIRQFGKEKVDWKIVFHSRSLKKLHAEERRLIKRYNSIRNGYNQSAGGQGTEGVKHSASFCLKQKLLKAVFYKDFRNRLKISKAAKTAHLENPMQRTRHSAFMKSLFRDKTRRKRTAAKTKRYLSVPENRLKHALERGAKEFCIILCNKPLLTRRYVSQHQCASELMLNVSHINQCLHGQRKSHRGFKFRFIK
jgi:predicted GIY-YIG superfamily endonuclease